MSIYEKDKNQRNTKMVKAISEYKTNSTKKANMKKIKTVTVQLAFGVLALQQKTNAQQANIILVNGKTFTAEKSRLYVQAVAITGNKIMTARYNEDIEKLAASQTRKIKLSGKTVVHGFNDAHEHLGWAHATGHFLSGNKVGNSPVGGIKRILLHTDKIITL
jgi:adenine deaminase